MAHHDKVKRISDYLKKRRSKQKLVFVKKAVSHQVPKSSKEEPADKLDLSGLDSIIDIDKKNKTCTAEPGVTFSDLVKETLKQGLVPYTVPELKGITVGGAVAGCSVESMSYKHGGFHNSCLEYEIVTAKGDIIVCSKKKNQELFEMIHGTFGTLGIITRLKFKLLPAKRYVRMAYETYPSLEKYKEAVWSHYTKKDCDFMDGIIHSKDKFVLCIGNFTDSAPYTHRYDWLRVFYKSTATRKEDYIRTYDYFFRYDSGCHWIAKNYGLENPFLRLLLGKFILPSTNMLKLAKRLSKVSKKKPDVVVDVFVPFSRLDDFFSFYTEEFDYFPLWIVPYRTDKRYPWINPEHFKGVEDNLMIDIAIYGMRQDSGKNYYRMMEEHLLKLPGIKTLISYNYLSQDEFWKMWSKENYYKLKMQTDPDNIFNDIYHKMLR